jgi:hypothetical protein
MSTAQVEKFFTSVCRNPAALEEVSKDADDLNSFVKNIVQYAKHKGYEFTEDEARTWILDFTQQSADGALQDSELESVAGGATSPLGALGAVLKGYVERHRV